MTVYLSIFLSMCMFLLFLYMFSMLQVLAAGAAPTVYTMRSDVFGLAIVISEVFLSIYLSIYHYFILFHVSFLIWNDEL